MTLPTLLALMSLVCFSMSVEFTEDVISPNAFTPITRFCFSKDDPHVEYVFTTNLMTTPYVLYFYEDDEKLDKLFQTNYNCAKMKEASVCNTASSTDKSSYKLPLKDDQCLYVVMGHCLVEYIYLYNNNNSCNTTQCNLNTNVSYSIRLFNGEGSWSKHISVDESGLLEITVVFTILNVFLCVYIRKIEMSLRRLDKFHHTVNMLKNSIDISMIARVFGIFYYVYYASSGKQFTVLLIFYEVFYCISDMLLVLLLILLAKGWTIVNKIISRHGRLKITLYATVYWWISILTILWRELSYKLWERGVLYRNTAGIFLIVVRGLVTLWFIYALYVTMKKITKKLHFYYKFGICGLAWFIINFFMATFIDVSNPTKRFTIYYSITYIVQILLQGVLTFLYNPNTRCNSSFPFHQKTADMRDIDEGPDCSDRGKAVQIVNYAKYFARQTALLHDTAADVTDYFDKTFSMIPPKVTPTLDSNINTVTVVGK